MPNEEAPKTVQALIQSNHFKNSVAAVLPTHLTPTRFLRILASATMRVPKLSECSPISFAQACMQLSQFGLEPDGRHAHLIPFWNSKTNSYDCQLIIDYKGLANLAMRSGFVSYVHADKICEKDLFVYDRGAVVRHEINFKEDRGPAYAYYAMVKFKDGGEKADVMTMAEVKAIRARSKAKDSGPWVTDFDEMGKKTVFRRLSKWLPLSPEYRDAVDMDADALEELRFEQAKPLIKRAVVPKLNNVDGGSDASTERDEPARPPESSSSTEGLTAAAAPVPSPDPAKAWDEFGKDPKGPPAEKKTEFKRKRGRPSNKTVIPPNQQALLDRLAVGNKTPADLMAVAIKNEWGGVTDQDTWPLSEDRLESFLDPENWNRVQEELETLP